MYVEITWSMLNCWFWICGSGWDLRICISKKLLGDLSGWPHFEEKKRFRRPFRDQQVDQSGPGSDRDSECIESSSLWKISNLPKSTEDDISMYHPDFISVDISASGFLKRWWKLLHAPPSFCPHSLLSRTLLTCRLFHSVFIFSNVYVPMLNI